MAERAEGSEGDAGGNFVKLEYDVETGEAERIAVDGVSKGLGDEEGSVVGNLITQRNAIRMLYDRITVLSRYIYDVSRGESLCVMVGPKLIVGSVEADHEIIRQISSLVASLPTIDAQGFRDEFEQVSGFIQRFLSTDCILMTGIRRRPIDNIPLQCHQAVGRLGQCTSLQID